MNKSSLLLATLLAVALSACGKSDEPAPVAAPAPAPVMQPATPAQESVAERTEEATEAAEKAIDDAVEAADDAAEAADDAAETAEEARDEVATAMKDAAEEVAQATSLARESTQVPGIPSDVAPLSAVKAENLAKTKSCMACHAIENKLVGPSYKEVAEKRAGEEGALALLTEKIQKGGSGVYGPVPMPPNPQVNPEEAAQLAQWVLSLN